MKKLGILTVVMAFMFMSVGFAQEENTRENYQKEKSEKYKKEHKEDCEGSHDKDKAMAMEGHEMISDTSGIFLKQEIKEGMLEAQLGQIALSKVESKEARDLILNISQTQVELNQELKEIARDLDVDIPDQPDEDQISEVQRYRDMSNEEFTREYLNMIVAEQRSDIRELENLKEYAANPDLREWINNNLPKMRDQLQTAQNLQYNFDNNGDRNQEHQMQNMKNEQKENHEESSGGMR